MFWDAIRLDNNTITWKHLCQSLFFNKVAGLEAWTVTGLKFCQSILELGINRLNKEYKSKKGKKLSYRKQLERTEIFRDHLFSAYARISEKLRFLTTWYAPLHLQMKR